MIADAHCHFFSPGFFAALNRELPEPSAEPADELPPRLGWESPGSVEALADRWAQELDRHGVDRAALIASVHGDEEAVAVAVSRHPSRFVGFFMLNPAAADAGQRAIHGLAARLRCVSLFPAMHRYALDDPRVGAVIRLAADHGGAVFVHCGLLSVGARKKLGLASRFDVRLGDPLGVATLAAQWPSVPFIIPHFGAGMLREALMAMDLAPNVYLDTSSSNSWVKYQPGLTLDQVFRQALAVGGPSRLLFGTDSSFFPRGWHRAIFDEQTRVLGTLGLSEADRAMILGGNFRRVLGD
jgi:uncharacterized protein